MSALFISHDQQYNTADERNTTHNGRQRKRFRLLGSHMDGTEIDDLLSGRVSNALIRERNDPDHDKDDACQRVNVYVFILLLLSVVNLLGLITSRRLQSPVSLNNVEQNHDNSNYQSVLL